MNSKAKMINIGDLVEYIGPTIAFSRRPKFGIVFYVHPLVKGEEIGVYFGARAVHIHSKYLEVR